MTTNFERLELIATHDDDSPRRLYSALEYEPIDIPFEDMVVNQQFDVYPDFSRYVSVSLKRGGIVVRAGGFVGVIPINDRMAINVLPRVPIGNLDRMLHLSEYASVPLGRHGRYYGLTDSPNPSLLDLYARALVTSTMDVEKFGVCRAYISRTEGTSFPRGRIQMSESVSRHWTRGNRLTVQSTWFEHTVDIAINRCLKYALWLLGVSYHGLPKRSGTQRIATLLNSRLLLFTQVTLDHHRLFLDDKFVKFPELLPANRSYYADAIRIAKAIIQNRGVAVEKPGRDVLISSFLIEMDKVFETYILRVLEDGVPRVAPNISVYSGNQKPPTGRAQPLFSDTPIPIAKPDAVLQYRDAGHRQTEYPLICDMKYKDHEPDRDDINQAITYAVSYDSPAAAILYPATKVQDPYVENVRTISGIRLYSIAVDLRSQNLEPEEARLSSLIASLVY